MIRSIWSETVKLPEFPALDRDETVDVLVIGGGMAGLLCAYFLKQAGVQVLLCEANTVGGGTTSGTTAVLSAQHSTLYCEIAKKFGWGKASGYLKANLDALEEYRRLSRTIDCDFEEKPSYLYASGEMPLFKEEAAALRRLGVKASYVTELPLPGGEGMSAVRFPDQAQFHPLKFIAGLCEGLNIREHTRVERVRRTVAYAGSHRISARKIMIASHYPILNTHGLYPAKLYQTRSYVVALENAAQYGGTFDSYTESGMYFRNYGPYLLVGGGDHRTGKEGGGYDAVRRYVARHYPDAVERFAWAAQDCTSLDGLPYIGQYSMTLPGVFVATGFNEWGMTLSMAAAKLLTALVTGQPAPHAEVFNPSRNMFSAQLFTNIGESIVGLITPGTPRCPHLGCKLKWNAAERAWDCPCHGSRFARDGRLIDNPATGDLRLHGRGRRF